MRLQPADAALHPADTMTTFPARSQLAGVKAAGLERFFDFAHSLLQ